MELTIDQALQKGIEAHKAGKFREADHFYTAIIKAWPKHPDANHNMGVLEVGVSRLEEALPFLKIALETKPSVAQYWLSYINVLIKLERMTDAKIALLISWKRQCPCQLNFLIGCQKRTPKTVTPIFSTR